MGAGIQDIDAEGFVRGCLEDDREAAEAFFVAFNPRLVRLLRRRVGDLLLAEDLAQETLIRALDSLDRFDPARPLWPWLKAIALNLAKDNARRSEREVPCYEISRGMPDEADRCDQAIVLEQALGALPGRHRAALSLRYLNDWKPTDAAQFLGMSRPAFDQLLVRARRRLGVEYKRMESGLQGIFLLSHNRMKGLLHEKVGPLWRRVHSSGLPPSAMASVTHALTAAAVVITAITSPSAPPRQMANGDGAIVAPSPNGAAHVVGKAHKRGNERAASRSAPAGGNGALAGGQDGPWTEPDPGIPGKTKELTDPHHGVEDPEDVQIISLAFGDEDGSVVYATGKTHCRLPACAPVLFRSRDGGRTWTRSSARGLNGTDIAVPRGRSRMVFAMGSSGLQVSRNGGEDFGPALATGAPMTTGTMAVSPLWNEGDHTVLVGAQTLFRYRDSTGTADPYVNSLSGPFEPAYSPIGPDVFYLGAQRPNGVTGPRALIYRCNTHGCNYTGLPVRDQLPKVRPSLDDPDLVYAFTQEDLFVSRSRAVHFNRISLPWSGPRLLDLATLSNGGSLIAALSSVEAAGDDGLYLSTDGGASWTQSDSPLFREGTTDVAAAGSRIVVALKGNGLACSDDDGQTFARRCRS